MDNSERNFISTDYLFLENALTVSSLSFQPFNHLRISNKKILILAMDFGIAVKKIIAINKKLVLPSKTLTFFPFDEATESSAAMNATALKRRLQTTDTVYSGGNIFLPS